MTQNAKVVKLLEGGMAQVSVARTASCGDNCASCGTNCAFKRAMTAVARNRIAAMPGDTVVISTKSSRVIAAALMVYIVPFVLFFAGYAITALAAAKESVSALVSIGAFMLGVAFAVIYNRSVKKSRAMEFEITAFAKQEN